MQDRAGSSFGGLVRRAAAEEVRLDGRVRNEVRQDQIDAVQDVARIGPVETVRAHAHHVAREPVRDHAPPADRRANGVEYAAGIQPVGISYQPLLAERQLLTSDARAHAGVRRRAELGVREVRVDHVAKRGP